MVFLSVSSVKNPPKIISDSLENRSAKLHVSCPSFPPPKIYHKKSMAHVRAGQEKLSMNDNPRSVAWWCARDNKLTRTTTAVGSVLYVHVNWQLVYVLSWMTDAVRSDGWNVVELRWLTTTIPLQKSVRGRQEHRCCSSSSFGEHEVVLRRTRPQMAHSLSSSKALLGYYENLCENVKNFRKSLTVIWCFFLFPQALPLGAWGFLLSLNHDWFVCQLQRAEFLRKGSH